MWLFLRCGPVPGVCELASVTRGPPPVRGTHQGGIPPHTAMIAPKKRLLP